MNQRIYHGNIDPVILANALTGYFNRGNWRVQQIGDRKTASNAFSKGAVLFCAFDDVTGSFLVVV